MDKQSNSTTAPESIGELTENIVSNLRDGKPGTAAEAPRFELRMAPQGGAPAELDIADIQELAFRVRGLIHVTRLAVRDIYENTRSQTPDDLFSVDTTLSVAFDLARDLAVQLVEIGPSQLSA